MKTKVLVSLLFLPTLYAEKLEKFPLKSKIIKKINTNDKLEKQLTEQKKQITQKKILELPTIKKQKNSLETKLHEKKLERDNDKKNLVLGISSKENENSNENSFEKKRAIKINNNITEATITYGKHWAKPFPTTFKACVNDQDYLTLKKGKLELHTSQISTIKNKIKVVYEWGIKKWGKVWHHEQKQLEFEVPEKQEEFTISFCWDDDNRININNAKMINCSTIEPSNT